MRFLMFAPPEGGSGIVATKPVPGMTAAKVGGPTNIAWETYDIDSAYKELAGRGVVFTQPPSREPWGTQAIFQDQDGNQFQLHEGRVTPQK